MAQEDLTEKMAYVTPVAPLTPLTPIVQKKMASPKAKKMVIIPLKKVHEPKYIMQEPQQGEPSYEQPTIPATPELYFWTPENLRHFTKNLQIMSIAFDKQAQDRYKWIHITYDQERDNAYMDLNQQSMDIDQEEFEERKEEIRWDIAWQMFDEVNQGLETNYEIDLHCLDLEEAAAVTKQKIYDIAQEIDEQHRDPGFL